MQHHVHSAPRNAPHIRNNYHPMTTTNIQTAATGAPPPPPPLSSQSQQAPQHMREISSSRLNNHHHKQQQQQQPQQLHHHHHHLPPPPLPSHPSTAQNLHTSTSTNQMQKIRQQHQHLNSNSNKLAALPPSTQQVPTSYNNNSNSNYTSHHQQQQQHQQQQRLAPYNVGHFNQLAAAAQQHMAHVSGYPAGPPIHSGVRPTHHHHHQQQHYYVPNNYGKAKYNNNNNNHHHHPNANNCVAKTILQNPNRALKVNASAKKVVEAHSKGDGVGAGLITGTAATTSTLTTTTSSVCLSNNISITPEVVATNVTATTEIAKTSEQTTESAKAAITAPATIVPLTKSTTEVTKTSEQTTESAKAPITTAATTVLSAISTTNTKTATTNNSETVQQEQQQQQQQQEPIEYANNAEEEIVQHKIGATLANEDTSIPRNFRDKTTMCIVNELARYNKVTHQYRLTGERGPAHSKIFTVTLQLGDEEFSADGFRIKKAQHLAAAKAIEETKLNHPPPKSRRGEEGTGGRMHLTPTVELNALAMKLGQRTYYVMDHTQTPPPNAIIPPDYVTQPPHHMLSQVNQLPPPPPFLPPGMPPLPHAQQRYPHRGYPSKYPPRYPMPPPVGTGGPVNHMKQHLPHRMPFAQLPLTTCKVTLLVGKQKFIGTGRTLQQAKHDAAARALQLLKTQEKTHTNEEPLDDSMDEDDKKSPVSKVHEIGYKRNMAVHFKVLREDGPAHMKSFITACIVGSIVTEGEGNGKKVSKKRAASKMLIELQKLPPLTPTKQPSMNRIKVKTPGKWSASSSLVVGGATPNPKLEKRKRWGAALKEKSAEFNEAENPITKLIQLQQTRKEKEPIFELIAKNGNENSRKREFIMEVTAGIMVARGTGYNKKLAKRNAAQNLLNVMEAATNDNKENAGEQTTQLKTINNNVIGTALVPDASTTSKAEPKKLDVPMIETPAGPIPGILILRQNKKHAAKKKESVRQANDEKIQTKQDDGIDDGSGSGGDTKTNNSATNNGQSPTNDSTAAQNSTSTTRATAPENSTTSSTTSSSNISSTIQNNNDNLSVKSNLATIETTSSESNESTTSITNKTSNIHMKEQLLYLSNLFGFEVNFSDYPKGNHNEFLTIVTLSTDPPQICHGVGSSAEESQNDAATNALKILSELGLNNAKNGKI